jgi:hypothetical protein
MGLPYTRILLSNLKVGLNSVPHDFCFSKFLRPIRASKMSNLFNENDDYDDAEDCPKFHFPKVNPALKFFNFSFQIHAFRHRRTGELSIPKSMHKNQLRPKKTTSMTRLAESLSC